MSSNRHRTEIHASCRPPPIFCGLQTTLRRTTEHPRLSLCLGLPGPPVLNQRVVELALGRSGAALRGAPLSFARKNYFYPDLPKGFRFRHTTSAGDRRAGALRVGGCGGRCSHQLRASREDAGKSLHAGVPGSGRATHLDFNRSGVPLIEVVTHPDLRSSAAAADFFSRLRAMFRALGVNDGNMEEGSLRCDANVSVRPPGTTRLGVKVEVKNINSFRFLEHALDYELERQSDALRAGGAITQETRLWDAAGGRTLPMRSKEEAHDYRYFPEPDLPPLEVSTAWVAAIAESLPELPEERRQRLVTEFGVAEKDAAWLAQSAELTGYFEDTVRASGNAKAACNWMMGSVSRYLNEHDVEIGSLRVAPERLAELVALVESGTISTSVGRTVFERMAASGEAPRAIVEAEGLVQIDDSDVLGAAVREALEGNPDAVASYRAGKTGTLGFLVGQVMRRTQGRANPRAVRAMLLETLEGSR